MEEEWIGHIAEFDCHVSDRHKCTFCDRVLHNPIQAECGHLYCKSCLFEITRLDSPVCKEDELPISEATSFNDVASSREIGNLRVKCIYSGCGCEWTGCLNALETHLDLCKFRDVKCKICGQMVKFGEEENHLQQTCVMRPVECRHCKEQVAYMQMEDHWKIQCEEVPRECPNACDSTLTMKLKEMKSHLEESCPLVEMKCPYSEFGCKSIMKRKDILEHLDTSQLTHIYMQASAVKLATKKYENVALSIDAVTEDVNDLEARVEGVHSSVVEASDKISSDSDELRADINISNTTWNSLNKTVDLLKAKVERSQSGSHHEKSQSGYLNSLTRRGKTLREDLDLAISTVSRLEMQILQLEDTSHTGSRVFVIDEYDSRFEKAKQGAVSCYKSAPFHTGFHGYKLCAKVFLYGDGDGKGTHISAFIAIMKNTYDCCLKWPFDRKFQIKLINQHGKGDVSVCFSCANASESSIQRPVEQMNRAMGSPRFLPLERVEKDGFVKDNCLVFKFSVGSGNE